MPQRPFDHSADTLESFFSLAGRGFYIPHYQRPYSWDANNAEDLMSDLLAAVHRCTTKPENSIFLGTVILHQEPVQREGVHTDTRNLLTRISNIVDGQQRITSLGLLGCVLDSLFASCAREIRARAANAPDELKDQLELLASTLINKCYKIRPFYSVEIPRPDAIPNFKPKTIRAGDFTQANASDKWTLKGRSEECYQSSAASFLAKYIEKNEGESYEDISAEPQISSVLKTFSKRIGEELNSLELAFIKNLLLANYNEDATLYSFLDCPPDDGFIDHLVRYPEAEKPYYKGIMLLAVFQFLSKACYFVVIESTDEGLAFDMFQSLNATGTPLTAFEVFKPAIVREWGVNYSSEIQSTVDSIESIFSSATSANRKLELTDKVVGSTALVFDGQTITKHFSDERDFLMKAFGSLDRAGKKSFVNLISSQAAYVNNFVRPIKPKKNRTNFKLVKHLQDLGLSNRDADLAALCVFYLRDANHHMAHSVLSVFYKKLCESSGPHEKEVQSTEFLKICKAIAAFFTLWMGSVQGRFPDSVYRSLFQNQSSNISHSCGLANQNSSFVKSIFRKALESQGVYCSKERHTAKDLWVEKSKENPWYSRRSVCRFGLLVASHDASPALDKAGYEGLFVDGRVGSAQLLGSEKWYSDEYEVIEHIATRDRPSKINFPEYFDERVYPGNKSIVDKIGNLTLLSRKINSSLYSEWPDKAFYFCCLSKPADNMLGPNAEELKAKFGIENLPQGLESFGQAANYLPHLAPLAYRGSLGLKWDKSFIEKRSEHLCERIFDTLDSWLRD